MKSPALQPRRDLTLLHATSLVVGITIGTGCVPEVRPDGAGRGHARAGARGVGRGRRWSRCSAPCVLRNSARCCRHAGGEYVYLRAAYGEVPAFLYACNSFVLGGASVAAYGAAVAVFTADIYPLGAAWFAHTTALFGTHFTLEFGPRQLIAVGVIAVFALINCAGVMLGGRVQTLLTIAKVCAILGVAGGVFLFSGVHGTANLAARRAGRQRRLQRLRSGDVRGPVGLQRLAVPAHGRGRSAGAAAQSAARHHRRHAAGAGHLPAHQPRLPLRPAVRASGERQLQRLAGCPSVAARAVHTFLGARAAPGGGAHLPLVHHRLAERHDPHACAGGLGSGARRPVLLPVSAP